MSFGSRPNQIVAKKEACSNLELLLRLCDTHLVALCVYTQHQPTYSVLGS